MTYKVAKSSKVRGTKHNNIDRAVERLIKKGSEYSIYKTDAKGHWHPIYLPTHRREIDPKIYSKVPKSRLR